MFWRGGAWASGGWAGLAVRARPSIYQSTRTPVLTCRVHSAREK
jgi:hypothetical protein